MVPHSEGRTKMSKRFGVNGMTEAEIASMIKGTRLYSVRCGSRFWYYTGRAVVVKPNSYYSNYHEVGETIYLFRDVCEHTDDFSADQLAKYFEVR